MDKQTSFLRRLKDVEPLVRRTLRHPQRPNDTLVLQDAYIAWYAVVCDTIGSDRSDLGRFTHTFLRMVSNFSTALQTVIALKNWDECLVQSDFSIDALKSAMIAYGDLGSSMWRALCQTATRLVRDEGYAQLRTVLSFMSRITLKEDPSLDEQARASFKVGDATLRSRLPGLCSWILRSWLADFKGIRSPKHGPGAVAEMAAAWEKVRFLGTDLELEHLLRDFDVPYRVPTYYTTHRISRSICVPKNVEKRRTICSEPTTLQFFQQGVKTALVDFIDRSPYLSRRIALSHPEYNASLAHRGSIDGSFATIDLSAASDSISLEMIESAFAGTWLKTAVLATRSTHCDVGDEVIRLRKAFAMGSALCFPCQCLIFASVCEYAIQLYGDDPVLSEYRVYGDDIVVETRYADTVKTVLEVSGFNINTQKSFTSPETRFRESCGGDYFLGVDAYPLRLSRRFQGWSTFDRHSVFESCVDLFNRAWPLYPSLRLLLSRSQGMRGAVYGRNADTHAFTLRSRVTSSRKWDENLQASYVVGRVRKAQCQLVDQDLALEAWFVSTYGRMHASDEPVVTSTFSPRLDTSRVGRVYGSGFRLPR